MASYATAEEFETYVEGWVTDNPDALDRLLERATRDIDRFLGARSTQTIGTYAGLKIDPADIETWEADALSRATCAQAEYRFQMGEDFFVRAQGQEEKGPDFQIKGKLPYLGPKAKAELDASGLRRMTTRAGSGRGARPPWYSFSYNVDDND